jgi:hypothetical protein
MDLIFKYPMWECQQGVEATTQYIYISLLIRTCRVHYCLLRFKLNSMTYETDKVQCHVYNGCPMIFILIWIYSIIILTPISFLRSILILCSHLFLGYPRCLFGAIHKLCHTNFMIFLPLPLVTGGHISETLTPT